MIPRGQAAVAALLSQLTGAAPLETHISAVFVGARDVFKLKKALKLPFLDFSTLAQREAFTRRELELNRPAAPDLYRGVLPVTRAADGCLALDGPGEVVDWVLHMAPVPEGDFLDAMAARQGLDGKLLDAVADMAAALHATAPVAEGVDSPARAAFILDGNRDGCVDAGLDPARVERIAATMRRRLSAIAPLLRARAASGHVRRCHGDLHLANLCLWEGRPVPFDALEFDEAMARTDTGYDLAFLVMDLEVRLGRAAANRVLNRALARSGDYGMLPALPFWMAQRALVRAKLEPARDRPGEPYLDAAERFLAEEPPRMLAIGGLQGTGKTRLARAIAPLLGASPGALHLRTDEIRKRRFGLAPEQRLPEGAYAPEVSAAVHEELFAAARGTLQAGRSVVVDAVFLDPATRAAAEQAAAGAGFTGIWLEAPLEVLRARVAARRGDASDATVAVLDRAAQAEAGTIKWRRTDAAGDPIPVLRSLLALNGRFEA